MNRRQQVILLANEHTRCDTCGRPVLYRERPRITYADGGLLIAVEHRHCPIVLTCTGRAVVWAAVCSLTAAAAIALVLLAAWVWQAP